MQICQVILLKRRDGIGLEHGTLKCLYKHWKFLMRLNIHLMAAVGKAFRINIRMWCEGAFSYFGICELNGYRFYFDRLVPNSKKSTIVPTKWELSGRRETAKKGTENWSRKRRNMHGLLPMTWYTTKNHRASADKMRTSDPSAPEAENAISHRRAQTAAN